MDKQVQSALSQILDMEIPEEMVQHILSLKSTNEVDDYFSSLLDYSSKEHVQFVEDFKEMRFKQKAKDAKKKGAIAKTTEGKNENKPERGEKSKKKNKFTNLYNKQGNVAEIMLRGRHLCNCQASKHKLINNCLSCGRIVCEQEGPGPCLFCGVAVRRPEDMESVEYDQKNGRGAKGKGAKEALEQRDRLLGYDRQSEKRTTVIDDESDYFKTHSVWLSDQEREKLRKLEDELRDRKHANRLRHKYKFDFSGRQILDDDDTIDYDAYQSIDSAEKSSKHMTSGPPGREIELKLPNMEDTFPELLPEQMNHTKCPTLKVQDKTFLEISDQGLCLSMHQPWASLLVAGIKKHEGRCWYTSHRGRLWIASTAKPPNPDEVKEIEDFYRRYYDDKSLKFPTLYPSGSLLGHVTVDDCLSQEDYLVDYPSGESESPYVFICTNPIQLPVIFPISGKHKIYKLDSNIHVAALRALQKSGRL
ncbi:activating signal cointegrator 1 [Lutzomyia longipalpis]|uniref:activating signal cointegrator 1 n=1 Tax=Lutzomyia longipalpis TaxID=7200 RepID=UPI002483D35C|nr:activating signal cointegrator 1 [Lutzomyia longipalpis]